MMFFSSEPKRTAVNVELTDGSHTSLYLEKGLTAYGKMKAGTYQVSLDQLKKVEIQTVVERRKDKI
jgi:hypothetical protein